VEGAWAKGLYMLITDETFCKHLNLEWLTTDMPVFFIQPATAPMSVTTTQKGSASTGRGRCTVRVRLEIHSFAQLELSTLPRVAFEEAVEFP
jgi:hypothetical protein